MADQIEGRAKTLAEAQAWLRDRARAHSHPMNLTDAVDTLPLIDELKGLDGASWAHVWGGAGDRVRAEAERAERPDLAAALYMKASGLYFIGRFPCPNHPAKERCAELERSTYLAAGRHWDCPVQRIAIPFAGRADEGREVVFLYRRPRNVTRPPLVVMWGGVDAWKEQLTAASELLLARGVATIAMDNAGTGESPVKGIADAERQFIAVFDWAAAQPDLDAAKVGCWGRSFGGYWATKLAHVCPERIAGAVNWGGGAHYMFQREWIEASRYPDSYLMELVETRCRMLGAANDREYIERFSRLSLLDQGLLDRPSASLLLVNGKEDKQCPVADIQLLIEHGSPKAVRLFPGGHMGHTPKTVPTMIEWLVERVNASRSAP